MITRKIKNWLRLRFVSTRSRLFVFAASFMIYLVVTAMISNLVIENADPYIIKYLPLIFIPTTTPAMTTINIQFSFILACIFVTLSLSILTRFHTPWLQQAILGSIGRAHLPVTKLLPVFFVVALVILGLFAFDLKTGEMNNLIKSNGSVINIFALLLSIFGLYYTALSLQDIKHVINTFDDFSSRFESMLRAVREDADRDHNYVRIMSYIPIPGTLGLKWDSRTRGENSPYTTIKDLLEDSKTRVEIVCLDEESLDTWMKGFLNKKIRRGRLDCDAIKEAKNDVETLIRHLKEPSGAGKARFAVNHPSMRFPIKRLPKFFAYFTNDRAIVINPLFNPIEGLQVEDQPKGLENKIVEFVGFETTDAYTIRNLHDTYDFIREYYL
jgi:hypothetical protein